MDRLINVMELGNLLNSMLDDERINAARQKTEESLEGIKNKMSKASADIKRSSNKINNALHALNKPKESLIMQLLIGTKFLLADKHIISYKNGIFYIGIQELDINDITEEDIKGMTEYIEEPTFQYMYKKNGKIEITDFITENDAKVRLSEYDFKKVEL